VSRPGVEVVVVDQTPSPHALIDAGLGLVAGITAAGPTDRALIVQSMSAFEAAYGGRVTYGTVWDAADMFYREGGRRLAVSRVVGPAAVAGSVTLNDGAAVPSLKVTAASAGDWSTTWKVAVEAGTTGGTVHLTVYDPAGNVKDMSPSTAQKADLIGWASSYVVVTSAGAGALPALNAGVAFAGGADDRASVATADWTKALDRFTGEFGPGQVFAPGRTDAAVQGELLKHAEAHGRLALLDGPDTVSAASLIAAQAAVATAQGARFGALLGPWGVAPGLAPGTTRIVPFSPVLAGIMARVAPGTAAAAQRGVAKSLLDLRARFTTTEYETLNAAGVAMARNMHGQVQEYANCTIVAATMPAWREVDDVRLANLIRAEAEAI
jgi:hypothetical protein